MAMQLFSGFNSSAQEIYYNTVVEKTFKMIVDNLINLMKRRNDS